MRCTPRILEISTLLLAFILPALAQQTYPTPIVNQSIAVPPGKYVYFSFGVGEGGARVAGRFRAQGGGRNDIEVYILDQDGFENWNNNNNASTYYNSMRVTVGTINVMLGPGRYYLVFNNQFSTFSNKLVQAQVYQGSLDSTRRPANVPSSPPSSRYEARGLTSYDEKGRMTYLQIPIAEPCGDNPDRTDVGTITRVNFNSVGEITDFVLRFRNGRQHVINLDPDLYRNRQLSYAEARRISTLIQRGKRVRVKSEVCGTAGSIWEAKEIRAI